MVVLFVLVHIEVVAVVVQDNRKCKDRTLLVDCVYHSDHPDPSYRIYLRGNLFGLVSLLG